MNHSKHSLSVEVLLTQLDTALSQAKYQTQYITSKILKAPAITPEIKAQVSKLTLIVSMLYDSEQIIAELLPPDKDTH